MRTLPRVAPDQTMSRLAPTGRPRRHWGQDASGVWAWARAKTASAATPELSDVQVFMGSCLELTDDVRGAGFTMIRRGRVDCTP